MGLKEKFLQAIEDEIYDDAYDEEGDFAYCYCGENIKYLKGLYLCPNCGKIYSREEFFNHIGAEPPGRECIDICEDLYPGCVMCKYGYVKENDD